MMEWRFCLAVGVSGVLATVVACGGSSEGTGDDGSGGGMAPTAGEIGRADAGTSGSAGSIMDGSAGTPAGLAGAPSGGTGSNVGGASVGGSSTAGTGGSGGMVSAECIDSEPPLCIDDSTIRACFEGVYETLVCEDFCENVIHFEPGPCDATRNDCACGAPKNPVCAQGVVALCECLGQANEPCDELAPYEFYIACYEEDPDFTPVLTCFQQNATFDDMGNLTDLDCAATAMECIPATPAGP